MLDISQLETEIPCPGCNNTNTVLLQDVALEKTFKCFQCNSEIHLIDDKKSVSRSINNINKSFQDLSNTIKRFNK